MEPVILIAFGRLWLWWWWWAALLVLIPRSSFLLINSVSESRWEKTKERDRPMALPAPPDPPISDYLSAAPEGTTPVDSLIHNLQDELLEVEKTLFFLEERNNNSPASASASTSILPASLTIQRAPRDGDPTWALPFDSTASAYGFDESGGQHGGQHGGQRKMNKNTMNKSRGGHGGTGPMGPMPGLRSTSPAPRAMYVEGSKRGYGKGRALGNSSSVPGRMGADRGEWSEQQAPPRGGGGGTAGRPHTMQGRLRPGRKPPGSGNRPRTTSREASGGGGMSPTQHPAGGNVSLPPASPHYESNQSRPASSASSQLRPVTTDGADATHGGGGSQQLVSSPISAVGGARASTASSHGGGRRKRNKKKNRHMAPIDPAVSSSSTDELCRE